MDYSKQGGLKVGKNAPRFKGDRSQEKDKQPGGRSSKEELLARMKAAAEAKKAE
ncbi:hypothetical protein [Pseudooceanicola sp. HF7]|uniref:hypothetical protein n=1 Tax=Pseudooceanicola sp. HF7 TaxID=2721560 RepID=UPI00142FD42D|nr:hypothetical protein [Pseudooceanicola sp. HF7]NIZ08359.1 hypothetical protein [Pseudooceanicola sp. HF7]